MMQYISAELAICSGDRLGEGPVWDAAGRRLLWSDHQTGIIHEAKSDGAEGWRETRRWALERPIAAALPRVNGGLIVAAGTEFFMMGAATGVTPFARLNADPGVVQLNDAKCDPQGRLWAGTFARDFSPRGGLYRVDADGAVTLTLEGAALANGMDWSPDGSTFYFIDSLTLTVDAFDFDSVSGAISNRRTVVTLQPGEGGGNGMTVDRDGCLWVALTGGGQVRRYSPDGVLLACVELAVPGVTSCAFGDDDGGALFITSRSGRMPDVAMTLLGVREGMMNSSGPDAGALFVCRPGPTGSPATPFAG